MKRRPMGWIVALLCTPVAAACGTSNPLGGSTAVTELGIASPVFKLGLMGPFL
jgi:hypothetical protein